MRFLQNLSRTLRRRNSNRNNRLLAEATRSRRLVFEDLEKRNLLAPVVSITRVNDAVEDGAKGIFRLTATDFTDEMDQPNVSLTLSGTADEEFDYSTEIEHLFLYNGSATQTYDIEVNAFADHQPENPPETVIATISSCSSCTIHPSPRNSATILIFDGPPPPTAYIVNVEATDPTAAELNSENGQFTITLDPAAPPEGLTVYFTLTGEATNGTDYSTVTTAVTFNENDTFKTVTIDPLDDSIEEQGGEDVILTLVPTMPYDYNLGPDYEAVVHIADNDFVGVSISDASVSEGQSLLFQVTLAHAVSYQASVNYSTSDGSATQPSDYGARSGKVIFNKDETSKWISVPTYNDTLSESTETMTVTLSNPVSTYLVDASGTGSILDRTGTSQFWIDDVTVYEGEITGGQKVAIFTVRMNPANGSTVTIDYATEDDTAIQPDDYTSTSGTLTFTTGQTSKTISVPIVDDKIIELTEQFFVNLSSPSTGTIQDGQGIGTILDNDFLSLFQPTSCSCTCTCSAVATGQNAATGTFKASAGGAGIVAGTPDVIRHPLVANMAFDPKHGTPDSIEVTPIVDSTEGDTVYYDTTDIELGLNYRFAASADLSELETGRHVLQLRVEAHYGSSILAQDWDLHVDVRNREDSEFGRGWQPTWVDRLHVQSGNVTWDKGDSNSYYFPQLTTTTYQRPAGELDFSTLTRNSTTGIYTLRKKDGETLTFSSIGILTSRADRNGNETTYDYVDADSDSAYDEISLITDPAGGETSFGYTSGRVTSIEDFAGRTTTLGYDSSGRLIAITEPDPDGSGSLAAPVTTIGYDGTSSRIATITDPTSETIEIRYAHGLLAEIEHPDGGIEHFLPQIARGMAGIEAGSGAGTLWDPTVRVRSLDVRASYENEVGNTWEIEADVFGNPTRLIDPEGNVTLWQRNADGLVTKQTDPDPDGPAGQPAPVTNYTYDSKGNVTLVTLPDGSQHTFTYDANFSQLTSHTGPQLYEYPTTNTVSSTTGNITLSSFEGNPNLDPAETTFTYTAAPTTSGDPPAGLVASVTDALDRVTLYEYDERANVTQITFADGTADEAFVLMEYDSADRLVEFTDEIGRITTYEYDNLDRLIELTLPDPDAGGSLSSPVWQYEYTANNQLAQVVDPLGRETAYTYTSRGDLETVTRPDHDADTNLSIDTYDYDLARRLIEHEDPLGRLTGFDYDTLNRQTEVTLADPDAGGSLASPVYQTAYDWLNRVTQTTDPLGHIAKFTYEKFGNRVKTQLNVPAASGVLSSVYDATIDSNPNTGSTVVTDAERYPHLVSRDGFGNAYSWHYYVTPDGYGSRRDATALYDAVGNLVQTREHANYGVVTALVYDHRDRLIEVQEKSSPTASVYATTEYAYNDASELISITDSLGHVTTLEYDGLGRLILRTDPDPDAGGSLTPPVTSYTYDAASRLLSVTDPLGHTTEYEYDLHDNVVLVIAEDTGETAQTYDDLGNLLSLTDPEGNTTQWTYDALYRVIEEENELADSRFFEYDAASRLTKKTDRNGRIVEYAYDNRDRLTTETWKNGSTTVRTLTFGYNLAGVLTSASDPAAAFTFTVDGLGQVREEIHDPASLATNIKLTRTLDAEGRQTQLQSYIGTTADLKNTSTYDFLSRLTGITQQGTSGGNTVAQKRVDFAYNVLDQFTSITRYANTSGMTLVATSTFAYDGLNRLTDLDHKRNSTTLAGYDFDYDAASRITEIDSFLDDVTTYSYDTTNQLTAADHTGQTDESYSFDLNGNRDMSGYTVGDNNQITSDGTYNYTYDDEGSFERARQ